MFRNTGYFTPKLRRWECVRTRLSKPHVRALQLIFHCPTKRPSGLGGVPCHLLTPQLRSRFLTAGSRQLPSPQTKFVPFLHHPGALILSNLEKHLSQIVFWVVLCLSVHPIAWVGHKLKFTNEIKNVTHANNCFE